ncbi:MAG TPA: VOC family protein [Solirubrobacteraceae bacterium]|nr:VOC family protein [Solirubrobacteraceae bacterium]
MIALGKLHHVALSVADVAEASVRWAAQFGLTVREQDGARAALACDDEPLALELLRVADDGGEPGFHHVAYELAKGCSLTDAAAHLDALGVETSDEGTHLALRDLEGNAIHLLPYAEPPSRWVSHARSAPAAMPVGHPRRLGHVNFLTGRIAEQVAWYQEALGMRLTDWLGDGGAWLRIGFEHHEMALVDKGYAHFHHLAFDTVDIGQMRDALDHLGRHGRWLGWGPTRHGVGGNIASYVRITEEPCFVELYCDMEKIGPDHEVRVWPDDRYSSNTWGPLPPRSYFRFDEAAVASERESLEMRGQPLADPVSA